MKRQHESIDDLEKKYFPERRVVEDDLFDDFDELEE
jgi:hypothetical protein